MGRAPCCEKVGLKRGPWTPEEDQKLVTYINENGHGSWRALPKKAGLLRCGKSCRLRWTNYLRPDIKRGEFSLSEEQTIIQLHALLGNRWSAIASHLPKRTDNEIKNYWNTHLKKKLVKMGLDPVTHKPTMDNTLMSSNADPDTNTETGTANLLFKATQSINSSSGTSHMAQWESARLEAESRLKQESQLRAKGLWHGGSAPPNPINVAPISTRPPWCGVSSHGTTYNNAVCADTLKALGAVELMHALHNWEKSLQGQAGMMWPEAWRFPGAHFSMREVQAESSSCSSHCSDANTSTSPLGTTAPGRLDHLSPTSTLCSLDSHSMKQKGLQSSIASGPHSAAHVRKLSWSDALSSLAPKLDMPVSLSSSKVLSGFDMHGVSCKVEEDSSTFSSLMQEAVFGTDTTASMYMSSLEEPASALESVVAKDGTGEGADGEAREAHGGVSSSDGEEGVEACEKQTITAEGKENHAVVDGVCIGATCGKDSNKESGSEALAHDVCMSDKGGIENVSHALLSAIDVEGDVKEGVMDLNNVNCDEKNEDEDDNDEGKSMCNGGEMVGAEVFKDLPKLKSKVSTPHLTSYCALLSEEIPDYWSSIMLKEPSLQPVDMTF